MVLPQRTCTLKRRSSSWIRLIKLPTQPLLGQCSWEILQKVAPKNWKNGRIEIHVQLTKSSKQEQGLILFGTFFKICFCFWTFKAKVTELWLHIWIANYAPLSWASQCNYSSGCWGHECGLQPRLKEPLGMNFFGGCPEVKRWINFTDKKIEDLFLSEKTFLWE